MKAIGIICEYNPFHNGHRHQIETVRSMGYDCVVCVMSGNFTQRGELAIADKYTRAKAAVIGGADLVFELPFPYSSFSAEGFAAAGVHILAPLGIRDLCFGSESADIEILKNAAGAVLSPDFPSLYAELQKKRGVGSASAYFEAIRCLSGDDAALSSNDILGISYICAIERQRLKMNVIPIKRKGAQYRDTTLDCHDHPSAAALRAAINYDNRSINQVWRGYIPHNSLESLIEAEKNELAPIFSKSIGKEVLSFFKIMSPEEIISRAILRSGGGESVAEDGCGICERLCNAAKSSRDLEEFKKRAYNSKYTDARINRVILFSLLGVSDSLSRTLPEYTTLLAASDIGRVLLSSIRKTSGIRVVTKPADAPDESPAHAISSYADILYTSAMPSYREPDYFIKKHPYMHRDAEKN